MSAAPDLQALAAVVAELVVGQRERAPAGGLLKAEELAERWQVPKAQVYRMVREGRLPVVQIGRYYRFQVAAVEEFEGAGGCSADG